ncbi:TRAP transporter small permease [Halomonas denitrificans]|uniref:TRAP transporter small permease n=1 Tax=Halomonas denitrificans TaxID=370769 RepID=UPI0028F745F6|nr:TRAP transporter small permease [Halomonas denitrificans]
MKAPHQSSSAEPVPSASEGSTSTRRGAFPPASPEPRSIRYQRQPPDTLDRLLDSLAHGCIMVAGVLLVFLIITFGWLVFGRYILNDTPTWVEQSALLCVVYITCLGTAAGVRHNAHLSIDLLRDAMPGPIKTLMHHLADLFVLAFGGFMAWQGWLLMVTNLARPIPMLGLSESWRAAPLVICGVLMSLFALVNIVRRLAGHPTSTQET